MRVRDGRERPSKRSGGRGSLAHYQLRQNMVAVGEDYWIRDGAGTYVYRVDGHAARLGGSVCLEDAHGTPICTISSRILHAGDPLAIEGMEGQLLALVHKRAASLPSDGWSVELPGDLGWRIQGNVAGHEYAIGNDPDHVVAKVSKRWFRIRDTYGVEVAPDKNQALLLAIAIAADAMSQLFGVRSGRLPTTLDGARRA
ncbi:LURP-one-related/scramblase family protein [Nocardioides sp. AN3]